ncbi:MAG: hypothetical protein O3A00_13895 [Planctomycetota bacterium]|nr:hypothetical protein [Planctomycetota bacterium]
MTHTSAEEQRTRVSATFSWVTELTDTLEIIKKPFTDWGEQQLRRAFDPKLLREALNDKDTDVRSSAEEGLQTLGFADG